MLIFFELIMHVGPIKNNSLNDQGQRSISPDNKTITEDEISRELLEAIFQPVNAEKQNDSVDVLKDLVHDFVGSFLLDQCNLSPSYLESLESSDKDMNYGVEDLISVRRPWYQSRADFRRHKLQLLDHLNSTINSGEHQGRRWGLVIAQDCSPDKYIVSLNPHKEEGKLPPNHVMDTLLRSKYAELASLDILCTKDDLFSLYAMDQFISGLQYKQIPCSLIARSAKEFVFSVPANESIKFQKFLNEANLRDNVEPNHRIGVYRSQVYVDQFGDNVYLVQFQPSIGNTSYKNMRENLFANKANLQGFIERHRLSVNEDLFSEIYSL